MKFFKEIIIFLLIVSFHGAFAKDELVLYKIYNEKGVFFGQALMIYGDKGVIVDSLGMRSIQITEDGKTTITIKDFTTTVNTGGMYWHRDGVGVMRNYPVQTSEGNRGMLYQSLQGTVGNNRIYNEKLYLDNKLISETNTVIDGNDQIVEQRTKNGDNIQIMKRVYSDKRRT